MLNALLISFAVVFVAELGDKSQLMAMTFAARFKWWVVLLGITAATALTHIASVGIGFALGSAIPSQLITAVAGISMLVFAFWTWRGDTLSDDESGTADRVTRSVFLAVASAFFLAELGDKTMLATITLTTQHNWFGVWIGSTLGMVAADALAIAVGALLGSRLPERAIAIGATVLFFGFGAWLLAEAWPELDGTSRIVTGLVVAVTMVGGGLIVRRAHRAAAAAPSTPEVPTADDSTPGPGRTALH
ncbi:MULTISPECIES: TMEM165/GDT1 family protein [Tsukamurella]|uniref:GDT1 family protein n=2 Tax=Tsukamurella TaxID=2060 RepID=A0A5C5RX69_9ACTN|nr:MULTISPECIES: TMEM165/GDT1 family protein [Tsukamurella]NMD57107.1 TMEM165/GDT1 family protein [Tsukamurella columbiensis]TWS27669.1 TMEM165/GDT1 family protein [Tsukamurella conjunctivitidis]